MKKPCKLCGEMIFNRKKNAVYCKGCSSITLGQNIPEWKKEFQKEVDKLGYIKALFKLENILQEQREMK